MTQIPQGEKEGKKTFFPLGCHGFQEQNDAHWARHAYREPS